VRVKFLAVVNLFLFVIYVTVGLFAFVRGDYGWCLFFWVSSPVPAYMSMRVQYNENKNRENGGLEK
jgi:hypothetical protein